MKCHAVILVFIISTSLSLAQTTENRSLFSREVGDSFTIIIRKPPEFNPSKKYHHVYMTDGNIGMGDYVLGRDKSWAATVPQNCIIIAIGHTGNWHQKRNRDLIPTDISKNVEKNFGHAEAFYFFLKKELIPQIEKSFLEKKDRIFIGHSLGGLFCLYTLFREDRLFDWHFPISPSCWANRNEISKIEKRFSQKNTSLKAKVTIFVGGFEFLNKVLPSTRSFYNIIVKRKYAGLTIIKNELSYANHFSIRKPAIDKIFDLLKD